MIAAKISKIRLPHGQNDAVSAMFNQKLIKR